MTVSQALLVWMFPNFRHVSTQTVGILGVGDVGSGIAAACKQLGMKTVGFSSSSTVAEVNILYTLFATLKLSTMAPFGFPSKNGRKQAWV